MIDADSVLRGFSDLLDCAESESEVQRFIEQHPWLVVDGTEEVEPAMVVSQFPLGADFRVDFAYITTNSGGHFINLVEIESPRLNIFNEADEFSASFNHAALQLQDWASWCLRNNPAVVQLLQPMFEAELNTSGPSFVRPRLHLFAGRRSQLSNQRRQRRWEERCEQLPRHTRVRTYDGLIDRWNYVREEITSWISPLACCRYSRESYRPLRVAEEP